MIHTPQIFIIYEPGMFGTFLTKLLSHHTIMSNENLMLEFDSDKNGFNAHKGIVNRLNNFHNYADFEALPKKETELVEFFKTLEHHQLSVHRLASYFFTKINYEIFFTNFVRIIVLPKKNRLDNYAERMYHATRKQYETEYWYKNIKKDIKNIPEFFKEQMSIKERKKYLTVRHNMLLTEYTVNQKHNLVFDPDDVTDIVKLQKLVDDAFKMLNLESVDLPLDKITKFVDNNKQFLKIDETSK